MNTANHLKLMLLNYAERDGWSWVAATILIFKWLGLWCCHYYSLETCKDDKNHFQTGPVYYPIKISIYRNNISWVVLQVNRSYMKAQLYERKRVLTSGLNSYVDAILRWMGNAITTEGYARTAISEYVNMIRRTSSCDYTDTIRSPNWEEEHTKNNKGTIKRHLCNMATVQFTNISVILSPTFTHETYGLHLELLFNLKATLTRNTSTTRGKQLWHQNQL